MNKHRITRRTALAAGAAFAVSAPSALAQKKKKDAGVVLFERDTVEDYAVWAKAFKKFAGDLKAAGVQRSTVYQSVDDPNTITVAHTFKTADEATAFLASAALKDARPGAGVTNPPNTWIVRRSFSESF